MARRTKEEAQATRHRLLDAAEILFQRQGVSRTSLQDIAQQAGATRGAIYWHFKDKADLFNAMMERVTLPLEESMQALADDRADPLDTMRRSALQALRKVTEDPQIRRVFEVATHMVEYVDDMQAVRQRHLQGRNGCIEQMAQGLALAARQRKVRLPMPAAQAAQALHALMDGLIQNWLLDPAAFDLAATGVRSLDCWFVGLGLLGAKPAAAPRPRAVAAA